MHAAVAARYERSKVCIPLIKSLPIPTLSHQKCRTEFGEVFPSEGLKIGLVAYATQYTGRGRHVLAEQTAQITKSEAESGLVLKLDTGAEIFRCIAQQLISLSIDYTFVRHIVELHRLILDHNRKQQTLMIHGHILCGTAVCTRAMVSRSPWSVRK